MNTATATDVITRTRSVPTSHIIASTSQSAKPNIRSVSRSPSSKCRLPSSAATTTTTTTTPTAKSSDSLLSCRPIAALSNIEPYNCCTSIAAVRGSQCPEELKHTISREEPLRSNTPNCEREAPRRRGRESTLTTSRRGLRTSRSLERHIERCLPGQRLTVHQCSNYGPWRPVWQCSNHDCSAHSHSLDRGRHSASPPHIRRGEFYPNSSPKPRRCPARQQRPIRGPTRCVDISVDNPPRALCPCEVGQSPPSPEPDEEVCRSTYFRSADHYTDPRNIPFDCPRYGIEDTTSLSRPTHSYDKFSVATCDPQQRSFKVRSESAAVRHTAARSGSSRTPPPAAPSSDSAPFDSAPRTERIAIRRGGGSGGCPIKKRRKPDDFEFRGPCDCPGSEQKTHDKKHATTKHGGNNECDPEAHCGHPRCSPPCPDDSSSVCAGFPGVTLEGGRDLAFKALCASVLFMAFTPLWPGWDLFK